MSSLPEDLLYTKDHEWIRISENGTAQIGITAYAQESLGDITFVEFPEKGITLSQGETFGVVESVKAASDLYMPISATVTKINEAVDSAPELVNQDPYVEGWLLEVKIKEGSDLSILLKPEDYAQLI
jgi:glycine cleavage system H protein